MHTLNQLRSGALMGTRRLDLSCGLQAIPSEVWDLADSLEVLNLSDNRLSQLPPELARLRRLKVIFCSGNRFTELPEVLGDCPALEMVGFKANSIRTVPAAALPQTLRWLTLTDNAITELPRALGQRAALQKLLLAGNQLQALPANLAQASRLELIRLAANQFTTLPGWLPELPRLAWLALAGNPLGWDAPIGEQGAKAGPPYLPQVDWADLAVDAVLGEGASGQIYRVHCKGLDRPQALKLFKGALTSDGLPEHEMAACMAAGIHPGLCTPTAVLAGHPQGLQGLLMPLVPPHFCNLAGPPSLDSCTRDIYPAGLQLPAPMALRLAAQVAGAMAHVHAQGVLHGDLYAHNILWNPSGGDALLSDFGAASLLPQGRPGLARALQALDVCAFGCLLEELIAHVTADTGVANTLIALAELAQACLRLEGRDRPAMAELAQHLGILADAGPPAEASA